MSLYENALRAWRTFCVDTEEDIDNRLVDFSILFAYHSTKLENKAVELADTYHIFSDDAVENFTGKVQTLLELKNQKDCYLELRPCIARKESVTLERIRETHRVLTKGTYDEHLYKTNGERPGEFKNCDYVTGIYEVGTPPELVEAELNALLEEINSFAAENDFDVLKAAAYFHAKFEYIHPFADGNGRVGRALMNFFLMVHNHPPLIIYDEDQRLYYASLEKYDAEENLNPFWEFLKHETEKTWKKLFSFQS